MLVSSALVQLMTPGVAFFYGGLVGEGSAVSTMMLATGCSAVVTALWSLVGYSMAFGTSTSTGIVGNEQFATLDKIGPDTEPYSGAATITPFTFVSFQGMFAIITSAIISGAVVGKMKWGAFMLFTAIWHLTVYCPLAHWLFYNGGWLYQYGAVDYAGGMVIHVSSGVSALVLTTWLGKPRNGGHNRPHNVPFVVLGAALLWFGWFGFNAGSALSAKYGASLAFINTQQAPAFSMLAWALLEITFGEGGWFTGRPTAIGAATAAIVGLVGVTPSAGLVSPMWAAFIGAYTAASVYAFPKLVRRLGFDDRLDTFAVHGIGGMVGSALTGLFMDTRYSDGTVDGSFYGNAVQLGKQCAGITVTIVYSAIATSIIFGVLWVLAKATGTTLVIPVDLQDQADKHMHGEEAYASASASTALATPAPSPTDDLRKELGAKATAHPRPHATSASELELEAEGVAVGGDNGVPGGLHLRGAPTLDSFGSGGATPPQGSPANPNPPAGRRSSVHGAVPATPERVTVHVEMVPHAQAPIVAV